MSNPGIPICHTVGLKTVVAVLLGVGLPCAAAFGADKASVLDDSFTFSLGTYIVDTDTDVQLNGDAGEAGTPINWNKTFGEGSLTRIRFDGQWRFGDSQRHKLRGLWFDSDRSDSQTIDRDIEFGGEVFPVSTKLKGELKYQIFELAYEYAYLRRDTYELSASIGAYYVGFDSNLSAKVATTGTTSWTRHNRIMAARLFA